MNSRPEKDTMREGFEEFTAKHLSHYGPPLAAFADAPTTQTYALAGMEEAWVDWQAALGQRMTSEFSEIGVAQNLEPATDEELKQWRFVVMSKLLASGKGSDGAFLLSKVMKRLDVAEKQRMPSEAVAVAAIEKYCTTEADSYGSASIRISKRDATDAYRALKSLMESGE